MCERKRFIRIPHLSFSPGGTKDDLVLPNEAHLEEREIVATVKLDGENTTLTRHAIWARSPDSDMRHPSRSYIMRLWAAIKHELPCGWRFVMENVYAKHSIYYDYLPAYAFLTNIIDAEGVFIPYSDLLDWAELLELEVAPSLWDGITDIGILKTLHHCITHYTADQGPGEGFVVRTTAAFHEDMARWRIAKWVRAQHVTTSKHWMYEKITVNKLRVDIDG
jgi:hypothetical protein